MQFSLEEADEILKKEYSAMKVDKRDFDFLNLELNYNFVMSYKFGNINFERYLESLANLGYLD